MAVYINSCSTINTHQNNTHTTQPLATQSWIITTIDQPTIQNRAKHRTSFNVLPRCSAPTTQAGNGNNSLFLCSWTIDTLKSRLEGHKRVIKTFLTNKKKCGFSSWCWLTFYGITISLLFYCVAACTFHSDSSKWMTSTQSSRVHLMLLGVNGMSFLGVLK